MVNSQASWHHFLFALTLLLLAAVFFLIFYSVIRFRRSYDASKKPFHRSAWVEYVWVGLPLLMCFLLMAPALWVWWFR